MSRTPRVSPRLRFLAVLTFSATASRDLVTNRRPVKQAANTPPRADDITDGSRSRTETVPSKISCEWTWRKR